MNIPQREDTGLFPLDAVSFSRADLLAHLVTDLLVAGAYLLLLVTIVHLNRSKYVSIRVLPGTYWFVFGVVFVLTFGASLASLIAPGVSVYLGYKIFVAAAIFAVIAAALRLLPRTTDPFGRERLRLENVELRDAIREKQAMEAELKQAKREIAVRVTERTQDLSGRLLALEKKVIEQRLEFERTIEAKRRLDELIIRTNTAHVFLGMDGVVLECNLGLAHVLGHPNTEKLVGRAFARLLGHARPDEVAHFIQEVARRGDFTLEMDVQPPARGHGAIELSGAAAVHGDAPCVMVLIRDTSDRRAAELKLLESREALTAALEVTRKANATRSDFLAKMNHELRTPLNGIIGLSEIIRFKSQGKTISTPEARKLVNNIHQSGRHLLSVVDDLLDLSRLDAGTRAFTPVSVVIRAEIDAALVTLGSIADKRRIAVNNRCPAGFEWIVDQRALKQIVINLVNNAVKFSPPGSTVDISLTSTENAMSLKIRDEGPGIAAGDRERILSPFGRGEYAEMHKIDGVGLGLAIVSELLKLQGGHIEIESLPRNGSTFIAVFPLATRVYSEPSTAE